MPSWPVRIPLGSPASSKPREISTPQASRGPRLEISSNLGNSPESPYHGVPTLSRPIPPLQDHSSIGGHHSRRPSYTRIPERHAQEESLHRPENINEFRTRPAVSANLDLSFGQRDQPLSSSTAPGHDESNGLINGRCATCDSLVRWPRQLTTFRCSICLMVNDLKPMLDATSPMQSQDKDAAKRKLSSFQMPAEGTNLSLKRTLDLIDGCIDQYLSRELSLASDSHPPDPFLGGNYTTGSKIGNSPTNRHILSSNGSELSAQGPSVPSPVLGQGPSRSEGGNVRFTPASSADPRTDVDAGRQTIFAAVEKYIVAGFSSVDCLNMSFRDAKTTFPTRAISEGVTAEDRTPSTEDNRPMYFPEIDAKTLLLGDVAENGTWWSGKAQPHLQKVDKDPKKVPIASSNTRVDAKSPHIDWREVDQWYTTMLSAGSSWRSRMDRVKKGVSKENGFDVDASWVGQVDIDFADACLHLQQTVLKASENLLRRPGRPIKAPEDCRFLLILLANPLLHSSNLGPKFGDSSNGLKRNAPNSLSQSNKPEPSVASRMGSKRNRDANPAKEEIRGKHSGIVKRLLGLVSNLPGECHQYFVSWFSRLDEPRFRSLVDLIGSFVSYRLSRQHRRKRSNNHDPTGGLIPSISGSGVETSAQLHAALGAVATSKKSPGADTVIEYSDDWQVKSAARSMSLLFLANNNDWPIFKVDGMRQSASDASRSRTSSSIKKRMHANGQLVPTSAFYNSMLDYADLIGDFEAWESRRGRFSFCQYPMFLSIWAKIRIMEHDAHRQMELKAREAFFSSIMSRKAVNQYLVLRVRRNCLVEDSFRGVSEVVGTGQEEIKKGLRIDFIGEEGIDSGGLRKEWFLLLVREIFDAEHGLFVYDEDSHYCYFNPNTMETSDQFFLVGVLLGLAIYNSTILDVALPPFAFRKLLASAPSQTSLATFSSRPMSSFSLADLSEYRPSLASGLRQLLEYEGDVESTFCRDFVAVTERYGQTISVPLCTNGERRPVTNANRKEFVDLYVRYLLDTSVARQYEPFKRGFFTVCGGNALSLFRPEEIELLIRGSEEPLDVATLRSVATYDNWGKGFDPAQEPVVVWFWDAFLAASPADQRKMLRFITASDRIPAMGATSLVIKVVCHGESATRLPTARTCFNMIALYRYPDRETLVGKLWTAVRESEGFGMK